MAALIELPMEQGATLSFHFIWKYESGTDDQDRPTYTAYDLDGCSARMQIRANYGTTVLVELDSASGGGIELERGGVKGRVDVTVSADLTDLITIKKAKADLEILFPSGTVTRVLDINLTNSLNITRDT